MKLVPLKAHTFRVRAMAVSPDGELLAAADFEGPAVIWNVGEGRPLHVLSGEAARLSSPKSGDETGRIRQPVRALAFSPDGRTLATGHGARLEDLGGDDSLWGVVAFWDVASGELVRKHEGHGT